MKEILSVAEKRRRAAEYQRHYRTHHPLTVAEKARKRAANKLLEQTPDYKAKAAAKYQQRREQAATSPRPVLCECCGALPNGDGRIASMSFEHCHERGTFHGWVCAGCNRAMGYALDRPELLRILATYIEARRATVPD